MPAPDHVTGVEKKISPTGFAFRILKTTERDAYDAPAPARPRGKNKRSTPSSRKAAKTR